MGNVSMVAAVNSTASADSTPFALFEI